MRGSEPQQAYILNKHCWQQSDLKSDYSDTNSVNE